MNHYRTQTQDSAFIKSKYMIETIYQFVKFKILNRFSRMILRLKIKFSSQKFKKSQYLKEFRPHLAEKITENQF